MTRHPVTPRPFQSPKSFYDIGTGAETLKLRPEWAEQFGDEMAKVIGKDETAVKRITCRECASIIEYTPHEVKSVHGIDYGGGPDGMEWVKCPECGGKAVIRSW